MATIVKLKSGNYRIRKIYKGRRYEKVVKSKPTNKEAERLLWSIIDERIDVVSDSFRSCCDKYLESKSKLLSPSTINGYQSIMRNIPRYFMSMSLQNITEAVYQQLINDYSGTHSPKSTRNLSGFVSAVLRFHGVGKNFNILLPQKKKINFTLPEDEDVKKVLEYCVGSKYEIPLWLACYGLRRSEICALTKQDLNGNVLTVNKAMILHPDKKYRVRDETKTEESTRTIVLSDYVCELIQNSEGKLLYNGSLGQINEYLHSVQNKLSIPQFSLHKLRHYFAATGLEVMPEMYVCEAGGWKPGSPIMKQVYAYTKAKKEKESKEAYAKRMSELFGK